VQDFAEQYPAFIAQLLDLFTQIQHLNQEITQINSSAPNSASRRIQSIAATHILANTKLLDLANHQIWPPPAATNQHQQYRAPSRWWVGLGRSPAGT
jgi:hypothetical protein